MMITFEQISTRKGKAGAASPSGSHGADTQRQSVIPFPRGASSLTARNSHGLTSRELSLKRRSMDRSVFGALCVNFVLLALLFWLIFKLCGFVVAHLS
jgi:hypothetical protein